MKVLITIPHYFNPIGGGAYGSTGGVLQRRVEAFTECLRGLLRNFGAPQAFLMRLDPKIQGKGYLSKANQTGVTELDIMVCTSGSAHLLDQLSLPNARLKQVSIQGDPMLLGFGAHQVLKSLMGRYDFYCYLEDDLVIDDGLWFQKLRWFSAQFGDDSVLFPHRFECAARVPLQKLYIDGPVREDFSARWQDINDRRHLQAEVLGAPFRFERWPNPHSGCFFLNAAQMQRWADSAFFGDRDTSFAGPLESAATLGAVKAFRVYKPSPGNANFFELRHAHNRYLGQALRSV
jgi:hypothetical protein